MVSIGIIGFGVVGQALYSCIKDKSRVFIYDKYKEIGKLDDCLNADIIFICIQVPTINGKQDTTQLSEILGEIGKSKKPTVIKSTVTPSFFENTPDWVVYNPEFLNQNSANEDMLKQTHIILGGDMRFCNIVMDIYKNEFFFLHNVKYIFCTKKEASELKYVHNIYHAYKVLFWHFVNDLTNNQRKIASLYSEIRGVSIDKEMARIFSDGKAGFGGTCFPKDLVALRGDYQHELLDFMIRENTILRSDEMRKVL